MTVPDCSLIEIDCRTVLRPLTASDAADIFAAIDSQREYLGRWLPFVAITKCPEDSANFVDSVLQADNGIGDKVFTLRSDDRFAGLVTLKLSPLGMMNRRGEIGYWLSEPFQHRGLMTAAVRTVMNYAFDIVELRRVEIKCAVGNNTSRNIPLRLGFKYEGTERCGEMFSDGRFVDIEVYSALSDR